MPGIQDAERFYLVSVIYNIYVYYSSDKKYLHSIVFESTIQYYMNTHAALVFNVIIIMDSSSNSYVWFPWYNIFVCGIHNTQY